MGDRDWPTSEQISREVQQGRARGGTDCCGTTGVLHRWFCLAVPPSRRDAPPAGQRLAVSHERTVMAESVPGDCLRSDLVDVSAVDLFELRGLSDSALARALRRILDNVDRQDGAVAGWQSAI